MICRQDNCLFIHIPKVAGQSIETVFLERAGLNWQQRGSMLLKPNNNPNLGPPRLAHLTAQEYVKLGYVSANEFNNMFSFTFVRNPWERLASEYCYRKYPFSFKDFLFNHFPQAADDDYQQGLDLYRHILPQTDFVYDQQNKLLVDFVGRFECLDKDFAEVTKLITGKNLALPHNNKTSVNKIQKLLQLARQKKTDYRDLYDQESQAWVAKLYQRDIELLGYRF